MALLFGFAVNVFARKATAVMRFVKVMGTVQSVNSSQMVITDSSNKSITIPLNTQTKVDKSDESALASQIQVGDRVSVRYDAATRTAVRIDILQPLNTEVKE